MIFIAEFRGNTNLKQDKRRDHIAFGSDQQPFA